MDPNRIQIAVFDGLPPDPFLLEWLKMFNHVELVSRFKGKDTVVDMAKWRNRVCNWFLNETILDALLFLEHSKLPMPSTLEMIACDEDIVGCAYTYDDATPCHPEEGWLGTGCLRMSRKALKTIEKPLFNYVLTDDGLNTKECSCQWFCRRAQEAGFEPKSIGRVGRVGKAVFMPSANPKKTLMQRYDDFCDDNRRP